MAASRDGTRRVVGVHGEQVNILCNMAEIVVRLVEAAWAQGAARAATATKLSRALSAYTVPLMFMDTGATRVGPAREWRVLYLNSSATTLLGAPPSLPPSLPPSPRCGWLAGYATHSNERIFVTEGTAPMQIMATCWT